MDIRKEQITGLVLAGGRGTRMGGVDKGLQPFRGEPLAMRAARLLQPQVGALLINANRHIDEYAKLGAPVCTDAIEGYAGPLAGMHAGLSACSTDYLVTVPCDSPLLPAVLVERLAEALVRHGSDAAVAVAGPAEQARRHPVFLLLKRSLLPQLTAYLDSGGRKVDQWLASLACAEAKFDDELAFANVNTLAELDALSASDTRPRDKQRDRRVRSGPPPSA